jgi:hypothetical protein
MTINFRDWRVRSGLAVGALAAISLGAMLMSAQPAEAYLVDVVRGVQPVSDHFTERAVSIQAALKELPPEKRAAYIKENYPNLDEQAVLYLERRGKLRPTDTVERVEFRFGSLDSVVAETGEIDADGKPKEARGYFKEQLVALVFVAGRDEPFAVIMECGNGLLNHLPEDERFSVAGVFEPRIEFTVQSGESLNDHTDHETALDFAERCGLQVTRGRGKDLKTVSVAAARGLNTDEVLVRVIVYDGDRFNLRDMTCAPANRRT